MNSFQYRWVVAGCSDKKKVPAIGDCTLSLLTCSSWYKYFTSKLSTLDNSSLSLILLIRVCSTESAVGCNSRVVGRTDRSSTSVKCLPHETVPDKAAGRVFWSLCGARNLSAIWGPFGDDLAVVLVGKLHTANRTLVPHRPARSGCGQFRDLCAVQAVAVHIPRRSRTDDSEPSKAKAPTSRAISLQSCGVVVTPSLRAPQQWLQRWAAKPDTCVVSAAGF